MPRASVSPSVPEYSAVASRVRETLNRNLGENSAVETEEGYEGRVRVKVVSSRLNGMKERQKQNYLWEILQSELGELSQRVSFVVGYGMDEL